MKRAVFAAVLLCWSGAHVPAAEIPRITLSLEVGGRRLEGMPMNWSKEQILLLARDGRLWDFHPKDARDYEIIADSFTSYPAHQMKAQLSRELGRAYDVSGTGHYLVAHPAGERDKWAQRFENLYRQFVHYFSVRGLRLKEPEFPLVAVVCPNKADFLRQVRKDAKRPVPDGMLGFYLTESNRVYLYDVTRNNPDQRWHENAETIIHEAAHQTAFNTGVHSRFGDAPRWVVEGLGTMFEARGVWDSARYRTRESRVNRIQLSYFNRYLRRRKTGTIAQLVSSDRMFRSDVDGAYAESWALTFFLIETMPRKYTDYLERTASHPPFESVSGAQRLADFTAVFGKDLKMLESRFLKFIAELQ